MAIADGRESVTGKSLCVYSQEETPEFRRRMDAWLADITAYLRDESGANYVSLILSGGYGRGWGAFVESPEGPNPVNDLDLVLVTRTRLPREVTQRLSHGATELISPHSRFETDSLTPLDLHADVMNLTRSDLERMPPGQFSYDLLESGRVIDGESILSQPLNFPASAIDPAAALLSIGNHSSSVYESYLVGLIAPEQMRLNLFSFAAKAAGAAGSAVLLAHRRYSALPDNRLLTLESMAMSGDLDNLTASEPEFVYLVREGVMARGFCSAQRLEDAAHYYRNARRAMMAAAQYCVQRLLQTTVTSPVETAVAIAERWRSEYLETTADPLWKSVARHILEKAGLRPVRASWRVRAPVYASAVALFAALSLDNSLNPTVDDQATRAAARILRLEDPMGGFEGWKRTAEAMVVALKRQNWTR